MFGGRDEFSGITKFTQTQRGVFCDNCTGTERCQVLCLVITTVVLCLVITMVVGFVFNWCMYLLVILSLTLPKTLINE